MQLPQSFMNSFAAGEIPPERQARDAILEAIGAVPEEVAFDGNFHRFKIEGDRGTEKSGWYILYGNGLPAGAFGSWRSGETFRWHAARTEPLSDVERTALEETYRLAQEERDARIKERHAKAAETCGEIWKRAPGADDNHPYLQRKKVKNHGLRVTGDGRLIMPVYVGTELTSLQYIRPDGQKEFHYGGKVSGGYFRIPASSSSLSQARFVAEGYATAASVHEATGCEVWVGLNAGNLVKVGKFLRENMPEADIVFVGDNDRNGTGQKAATEAAEAIRGRVIIPPDFGDANDYANDGKDLRTLLLGTQRRHWIFPFSEFRKQPQPIKWLIKGWIQAKGLHMVFGPSGVGKSFSVIDMAASIACPEIETWHGFKVKHGPVLYLAGEGYLGLKQRIVGWGAHKGVEDIPLFLSEEARDLNTQEGLRDTIDEIRSYETEPCLIIVDTLNRFMAGDENKAVDVKTMLDACAVLQREFNGAVCLVHHTGVSENAQDRARGSSAWRGAMDIEIQVKGDSDSYVTLNQTKNKDAERQKPLDFEMFKVNVPGWLDEDGTQITTKVIEISDAVKVEEDKLTKTQTFALQTFEKAAGTVGLLDEEGNFAGLERKAWRDVFCGMSKASTNGARRNAFYKAIKELRELGLIVEENDIFRPAGFMSKLKEKCYTMGLNRAQHDQPE
ncbi:MAG: AAA family ATPase [Synergistaceae bacterium]|nr:AAA family ATPase [Synergistaceae bacterium]